MALTVFLLLISHALISHALILCHMDVPTCPSLLLSHTCTSLFLLCLALPLSHMTSPSYSFALYLHVPSVRLTCPFTFSHMQASFPILVTLSRSVILYLSPSLSLAVSPSAMCFTTSAFSVSLCILFIPCLFSCLSTFPVSHMHFSLSFCFDCLTLSFLCSLHPFYTLPVSDFAYCFYPLACTFLHAFLLSHTCAVVTSLSCLLAFQTTCSFPLFHAFPPCPRRNKEESFSLCHAHKVPFSFRHLSFLSVMYCQSVLLWGLSPFSRALYLLHAIYFLLSRACPTYPVQFPVLCTPPYSSPMLFWYAVILSHYVPLGSTFLLMFTFPLSCTFRPIVCTFCLLHMFVTRSLSSLICVVFPCLMYLPSIVD